MTDVHVPLEFNDRALNTPPQQQDPLKLPRIDRNPSREGARSKAEKRKTPPLLPNIKQTPSLPSPPSPPPQEAELQADSFAMQIEQRLRMVLQNVNQGQEEHAAQSGSQSQTDFEALIQQNRQKLKQNKALHPQQRQGKPRSNTLKNKNENSLYEKRVKEYRDASVENKFIQKRKEIIALKQEANERANDKQKSQKPKEEGIKNSSTGVGRPNLPKSNNRLKFSAKQRKLEQTHPPPVVPMQSKTSDLFDNIHHFLQNPHKGRIGSEVRRNSKDNIKQLTEKIKQINQKLGVRQSEEETGPSIIGGVQQKTVLDWKRLEYNRGSNFRCHYDSNFQKEVDRIGCLQEKTSHSLSKFLDHQKTLVALTLLKKVSKRPEGSTA